MSYFKFNNANISQGTHVSDGFRAGPIFGSVYTSNTAGGNFRTPVSASTPADSDGPGVKIGNDFVYCITPYTASNTVLRTGAVVSMNTWVNLDVTETPAQQVAVVDITKIFPSDLLKLGSGAPGYNVLSNAEGAGVFNNGFTRAYELDVPRCVSISGNATDEEATAVTQTLYGIDEYGFMVVSTIDVKTLLGGTNAKTVIFPKAIKYLLGIYSTSNVATTKSYSYGTSDVFGLPYRLANTSLAEAQWNGAPLTLGAGSVQSQLSALVGAANLALGKYCGTPLCYGAVTTEPVATATSADVRGLILIPGYCPSATAVAAPQSNLTTTTDFYASKTLVVRMYLPFSNVDKPSLYGNPAPAGQTAGHLVLGEAYKGSPLCVPVPTTTKVDDLYGSTQFRYV